MQLCGFPLLSNFLITFKKSGLILNHDAGTLLSNPPSTPHPLRSPAPGPLQRPGPGAVALPTHSIAKPPVCAHAYTRHAHRTGLLVAAGLLSQDSLL